MARCYANENFPFPTVEVLRGLGHDVLTTVESGRAGQAIPDADVLAFAVAEDRIVITLNRRHFMRLHHTTPTHTGIVVCTFDPNFVALAQRIHRALEARPQMAGQCPCESPSGVKPGQSAPQNQPVGLAFGIRCTPVVEVRRNQT